MLRSFAALTGRDLALALRGGGAGPMAAVFFATTLTLVPLGVGPEPAILERIAAGMIWIAAALAALLSLERMFQGDAEDGTLDLLLLSPLGAIPLILAKCLAQWLSSALPLVLLAPLFAFTLHLPAACYLPLVLGLLAGTPAFFLIGALGAALTIGVRRGGLLIALIVLPLYMPFVIFGVGAVEAARVSVPFWQPFLILSAGTCLAAALAPLASAAALRLHLS